MNVAIFGDSFAASSDPTSWTQLLNCNITNFATNGSSEYRIVKKMLDTDLSMFDATVVVHTSSNRIFIPSNPLYKNHSTHPECDLIYADIESKPHSDFKDHVVWWFENVFDIESAEYMHRLMIDDSLKLTESMPAIHLTFFESSNSQLHCLHNVWQQHPGTVNHLSTQGNRVVANLIKDLLNERHARKRSS